MLRINVHCNETTWVGWWTVDGQPLLEQDQHNERKYGSKVLHNEKTYGWTWGIQGEWNEM